MAATYNSGHLPVNFDGAAGRHLDGSNNSLDHYQTELDMVQGGFDRMQLSGPAGSANVCVGESSACQRCGETFGRADRVFRAGGEAWHEHCFVCAQCFRPFEGGRFYEFDGRKYCEHDFSVLFKPCCAKCGEFIVGRVIRAMQSSWHPDCFTCQLCGLALTDAFVKNLGRALCKDCNAKERVRGAARFLCNRCHDIIEADQVLRFKGDNYHPYHFNCTGCRAELTAEAREKDDQLYCIRCFDKLGVPVCARCRRPIEERVVHAINKAWHVEHFVCAVCEKPFNGTRFFERRGQAYCETHFQQLFGQACFVCNDTISDECVQACCKSWCSAHFQCSVCDRQMNQKTKFYEYDLKPVCKPCYEKFPTELRKRLAKIHKLAR
ncbi:hypothetical protein BOX15_Mlig024389g1 [Macrostomum lignano]|uniref:LIM zinc-binding domain-containing protein n=1 Tax=Macrostomum lignano TaxID=282301 RepID=A0A267FDA8_9PLAT|nr:hypothetical protein BOX15_Mlig024389g1 [Macrostomum lignano]